ncbi:hypothetical protein KVV02_007867 [Mortierella alpina]|uniref:Uncharacterized protein n=1 Tax=Mortierella alpina TaxID=64518 RepID=A0A9P8CWP7_MORAP|nr:hypothetical protein KVV02_007867 [Mortierella alpina]
MSATVAPPSSGKIRCWGSLEYEREGKKNIVQFTKDGNDGESGIGGYVFGRKKECDFLLEQESLVSNRQFLIYKEMVHDPEQNKAVERVFLKDLSSNGTFVNDCKVGVNKRVLLRNLDRISYYRGKTRFIFVEGEPADNRTFDSQYERGPQLGSGNFATVFRATHRRTGVVYAVKVVNKKGGFSAKVESSLEREIGILMGIDHENLLRICEVFNETEFYYVVTELAPDGELFDQIIDKQKFTESETRHIFRQVLAGVQYLHERGVVHRDLKPENILVMDKEAMTVKISDFGLAKMIGEQVFFNTICGTPSYVAPEVIRNTQYGKGVDMWSLGVVLYICLCGFPPFSDDLAPPKLRLQVLQSMYTFPSPYWDDVSDEAVDFVQGLLAQSVDERLTVEDALNHVWMTMEDDEGTMPEQARTSPMPQVNRLLSRVMTERADRAVQRGVRMGCSQPTAFSQTIPDLPEDDENEQSASPELPSQEYPYIPAPDRGSGIGIFSQDGMVRGTGLDTDSEDDGTFYHHAKEDPNRSTESTAADGASDTGVGNDSDRSYMSVQETFNRAAPKKDISMASIGVADDAVASTAIAATTRASRSEDGSDGDERTAKRARTERA